ncbi:hypothetical protein WOLCODRAFT_62623 [Wolfiporia cocos MD-104 SS10]|uniref:Protein kinase domain-containing protein n=1 Tax=Wolfiporia cocos (strain MD-104) TaxID=742152 RepID=A0A2H3IWB9_WOLCO|nr:hypothetical protein WOLCODRAFT_62623 [Wolfiporia cocos MD-104 SS10]
MLDSILTVFLDQKTTYKLWSLSPKNVCPHFVARNVTQISPTRREKPRHYSKVGARVVYRALLQTDRGIFGGANCAPFAVALKWGVGAERVGLLRREAAIYENELRLLQGSVVPQCFGLFAGRTANGADVACLVLEWCGGFASADVGELNRQILLKASQIHVAGILHGSLLEGRHYVASSLDNTIRIIDFAHACIHDCPREVSGSLAEVHRQCSDCPELALLERTFGPHSAARAGKVRPMNAVPRISLFNLLFGE